MGESFNPISSANAAAGDASRWTREGEIRDTCPLLDLAAYKTANIHFHYIKVVCDVLKRGREHICMRLSCHDTCRSAIVTTLPNARGNLGGHSRSASYVWFNYSIITAGC